LPKLPTRNRRLTTPDLVVLALLAEKPMHGYELNQELARREVHDWARVSRAQVYYSLRKLSDEQMIAPAPDQDFSQGPERTVYRLNARGALSFQQALDSPHWATQRPPNPFITWLALSGHLTAAAVTRGLKRRRGYLKKQLDKERSTLTLFGAATDPMAVVGRSLVSLGIAQFETELHWMDQTERALSRGK
jgi:DNA-binding PadR family transcriptional regulator